NSWSKNAEQSLPHPVRRRTHLVPRKTFQHPASKFPRNYTHGIMVKYGIFSDSHRAFMVTYGALTNQNQPITALPMVPNELHTPPQFVLRWRIFDKRRRLIPGDFKEVGVPHNIADLKGRHPRLAGSKKLPRPSQFQVHLSNVKPVVGV